MSTAHVPEDCSNGLGSLAALSVGAAAIHFAVVFERFTEYALYGVFFLVISWAQVIWPARSRLC